MFFLILCKVYGYNYDGFLVNYFWENVKTLQKKKFNKKILIVSSQMLELERG